MIVNPMSTTTPATPATGNTPGNVSSSASSSGASSADDVNMNQFLQLLVAQIQNQDPTNPADSTAFLTQLAQFSELEQTVAIRGDIESQMPFSAAGAATGGTQGTNSSQGGS